MESLKFTAVHEQKADRSCAFSVASSILNLYLCHPVDESTLIERFHASLQENGEVKLYDN